MMKRKPLQYTEILIEDMNKTKISELVLGRWWNGEQQRKRMSEIWSPDTGIQQHERRKREVSFWDQQGFKGRIRTHRESKEKDLNAEETGASDTFSLSPSLQHGRGGLIPEAYKEKCISETEQQTLQIAVASEFFQFRCPPGEGNWPVTTLERDQLDPEFCSCRLATSSFSQCQGEIQPS